MQRVRQQGKLTNDVQERREAIGQAVSARREGIQTVPDCKNGVRSGSWGEEWQQRGKRARVKGRTGGCLDGSYRNGTLPGGEAGQNKSPGTPRTRSQGRRNWVVASGLVVDLNPPMTMPNEPILACSSNTRPSSQ
jgi:hypothetical protein